MRPALRTGESTGRLFLTSLFATKIRWGLVEEELVVLGQGHNQPEALTFIPPRNPWGSHLRPNTFQDVEQ